MTFLSYRYVQKLPVGLSKRRIWIVNVFKKNGNLLDLRKCSDRITYKQDYLEEIFAVIC